MDLYLKRLEIYGFKSFGTKSVLDFDDVNNVSKIAAIVGPNGSGKSNVADSVRWVLGEQSNKTLRSKKNEDVIFCGSSTKPRSSYAEISMILGAEKSFEIEINNKKHTLNEIEIARKLYRSGDSEYLINRKKVRLIDIQQVLASLGFGQSTYTVIGQGMVDRLLFFNATERKVLFDEAAGVKQYEIKREQAIRKLEGTDTNLIRLKDILTELEPRVTNLRRLVKRAEGRKEIETELSEIQNKYYFSVETELKKKISEFTDIKEELNKKVVQFQHEIAKINDKIENSQNYQSNETALNELEQKLNQATTERDQLMQKVAVISAQISEKTQKFQNIQAESLRLAGDNKAISEKIDFLTSKITEEKIVIETEKNEKELFSKELAEISAQKNSLDQKLQLTENASEAKELEKLEEKNEALEVKRREVSSELFSLQQKLNFVQNESKRREERAAGIQDQLSEIQIKIKTLNEEIKENEEKKNQSIRALESQKVTLVKMAESIGNIEKELENLAKSVDQEQVELFEKEVSQVFDEYKEIEQKINSEKVAEAKLREIFTGFLKSVDSVFGKVRKITQALNQKERVRIESELNEVRKNRRATEEKIHELTLNLERAENAISILSEKLSQAETNKTNLESELLELRSAAEEKVSESQLKSLESELAKINLDTQKIQVEIREKAKGVSEKRQEILAEKNSLHEKESGIRRKLYEAELNLGRKLNTIENQERELRSAKFKFEENKKRLEALAAEKSFSDEGANRELEVQNMALEEKNNTLTNLRQELSVQLAAQREQNQVTLNLERERRNQETEIATLTAKINQVDLEAAKYQTRLEDLESELELSEIKLDRTIKIEILDQQSKDTLRVRMENLRRRLETIGGVDPETVAEYEELESRSTEMSSQVGDLDKAKADLENIIRELDVRIKKQFSETFSHIATEFNRYFTILFNGGKASLNLGEDEEGNYGIEITANPPGKKLQNLNALSGGERTLTSLALLFAIQQVNPSPFCVLDEVDAALDESNTLRFAKIIQDLAGKTQFLVISHNRETMKAADSLYGITMDTDHISKLISIRLAEALEKVPA